MNYQEKKDAFDAYLNNWKTDNPQSAGYIPFDLMDFFFSGIDASHELAWHDARDTPLIGRTIFVCDDSTGHCEICYGGDKIRNGYWAYVEDIFSHAILMGIHEREEELKAWMAEEKLMESNHH